MDQNLSVSSISLNVCQRMKANEGPTSPAKENSLIYFGHCEKSKKHPQICNIDYFHLFSGSKLLQERMKRQYLCPVINSMLSDRACSIKQPAVIYYNWPPCVAPLGSPNNKNITKSDQSHRNKSLYSLLDENYKINILALGYVLLNTDNRTFTWKTDQIGKQAISLLFLINTSIILTEQPSFRNWWRAGKIKKKRLISWICNPFKRSANTMMQGFVSFVYVS